MTGNTSTRRRFLAGGAAAVAASLAGCTPGAEGESDAETPTAEPSATGWREMQLTAARREESFSIAGLSGPVVLETFAVWCPVCTRQQEQLAMLDGAELTRLSLNVDPNESADMVATHADSHGFDWRYAVAPAEMTESLIDEFGSGVTVAPSAPVIVVCDDGAATYLQDSGVKEAAEVRSTAREC